MNRNSPYRHSRGAPHQAQNWQPEDGQSPYAADGDFDAAMSDAQRNDYPRAEDLRNHRGVQRGAYGRYDEDDRQPRGQDWGYGDYAAERGVSGLSRRDFPQDSPYAQQEVQRGDYRGNYGHERGHGGDSGYYGRGVESEVGTHGGYAETHSGRPGSGAYGQPRGRPGEDFAGRGPKDYVRSDERLTEDINERLTADPYIDASEISVSVKEGVVTLSGNVPQRPLRYHAEDIVECCRGVRDIDNQLKVAGRKAD
jgi:osmotically-inducible protein OsmY